MAWEEYKLENAILLSSLQIQGQQFLQNLLITQVTLPAIRGEDGFIEAFVGEIEPAGTGVI